MKKSAYESIRLTEKQFHVMILGTVSLVLEEICPQIPIKKTKILFNFRLRKNRGNI